MSFLEKIEQCNAVDYSRFIPLMAGHERVGWIRRDFIDALKAFPDVFDLSDRQISISSSLAGFDERTQGIQSAVHSLVKAGRITQHYAEVYPASTDHRERPVFLIDRAAASYFGTRTYGQHLNGYVRRGEALLMWIGRRAKDRGYYPGKLDQIVAGGLPYNISLQENLRKECLEEAGIDSRLADQAKPVGCITCTYENERGIKPETQYCYDLELPEGFEPVCQDGEVDEFMLMPIDEVMGLVRDTDEFKLNCNLVVIDFLIRHGIITPDEPDYEVLVSGLHQ